MLRYMIAAMLLVFASPAYGEEVSDEWYYITTGENGTKFYGLLEDLAKGRSNQTGARLWVLMDSSEDRTITSFSTLKTLYVVNCVAKTFYVITSVARTRTGQNRVVPGDPNIQFVVPDTTFDSVVSILCSDPKDETPTRRPLRDNEW